MEQLLYQLVKASERQMPMSDDGEITFHAIIENDKGQKTSCVVWHLGENIYKNTLTGSYYEVPKERISWLEPIEESEQDDLGKLLESDIVLKDVKLDFVKAAIIRLVESQSFKKYSKGYKDGWNEAMVPVNQDELWDDLTMDLENMRQRGKPSLEQIKKHYHLIKK